MKKIHITDVKKLFGDVHLRVKISLCGSVVWNTIYAVFMLALGIYHSTFWFCSLAGYYFSLAIMRFFLVRYTRRHTPGENMKKELTQYRACGVTFFVMNLTIAIMIFFMVYWNRTFYYHEIITITLATYTFTAFTIAIINVVKYRQYNSPVYSASKAVSLAAACVSMITLESAMLTVFDKGEVSPGERRILLGVSGGIVSAFIIGMAIYMIVKSSRKLRLLKTEKE